MLVVGAGLTTQVWPVSNYHLRSDNQDSNARQQSMPSPPKIQYGNWSARTGSETETQRTARVLGILFPNPPLSSEGEVAARRQGYNAGPAACYIEVPATLSSSLLIITNNSDFLLQFMRRGVPTPSAQPGPSRLPAFPATGACRKCLFAEINQELPWI